MTPRLVDDALESIRRRRDGALEKPAHDDRSAAVLGIALGVSFTVCFLTGLYSHLLQQPPTWIAVPPSPAGLYRVTQGLHVATGIASIPLLLAKLWSVYPRLFSWPPFRDLLHLIERLALVVLVGGSLFMLFSGTANIERWYPWRFFFPAGHYWAAWITMGALIVHVGAKVAVVRRVFGSSPEPEEPAAAAPPGTLGRRGFLTATAAASGLLTLFTVGQTVGPLGRLAVFSPRRPDIGPQGIPVNATAVEAGVLDVAQSDAFRLRIRGDVGDELTLTRADLEAMDRTEAVLPIACVEGWSASARWGGVPVRELLEAAGVNRGRDVTVEVRSLERNGLYGQSILAGSQVWAHDTLLALTLDGEDLHIDHGFPVRLIAGNRPGVMQTKWVGELVVR
ncbi:MAG TPA: molybdopterin-dependent oxidoreductase [Acidimicrobiales bacterium]